MGEIYHSWNGTILTITSDSGTSSADLQGEMGVRGPQGPAGGGGEIDNETLNAHIQDTFNPHFVTTEQIGAATKAELGDILEIYDISHLAEKKYDGKYMNVNGQYINQEDCSIYTITFSTEDGYEEQQKLKGKRLRVKTYAYGDMSYRPFNTVSAPTNTNANIEVDRLSGIWEFEVNIAPTYNGDFYISFCNNPFMEAPQIAVCQGTVWEEIKALQEFKDNLTDYLPIYNGEVLE